MTLMKVAELLAQIVPLREEEILPSTALAKEKGIEALDLVKLVMACEKKFKIIIHDEDVHQFKCVGDIVDYIDGHLEDGTTELALHDETQRRGWFYK